MLTINSITLFWVLSAHNRMSYLQCMAEKYAYSRYNARTFLYGFQCIGCILVFSPGKMAICPICLCELPLECLYSESASCQNSSCSTQGCHQDRPLCTQHAGNALCPAGKMQLVLGFCLLCILLGISRRPFGIYPLRKSGILHGIESKSWLLSEPLA